MRREGDAHEGQSDGARVGLGAAGVAGGGVDHQRESATVFTHVPLVRISQGTGCAASLAQLHRRARARQVGVPPSESGIELYG